MSCVFIFELHVYYNDHSGTVNIVGKLFSVVPSFVPLYYFCKEYLILKFFSTELHRVFTNCLQIYNL